MCVYVNVYEFMHLRERERERESVRVCTGVSAFMYVRMCGIESAHARLYVRLCSYVYERDTVGKRESVRVCVPVGDVRRRVC